MRPKTEKKVQPLKKLKTLKKQNEEEQLLYWISFMGLSPHQLCLKRSYPARHCNVRTAKKRWQLYPCNISSLFFSAN